ncbi:hypothetical protein K438DRAFT_1872110 [Mycena galopus ATCC 62051]|nr:hypothetical protein K438DRAFT_1872110 [Mycena galopus ATCC 62051]
MRPGGDKEEVRAFAFLLAFFGLVVRDLLRVVRGTGSGSGIGALVVSGSILCWSLHLINQPRTCPCRPLLKFFSVHSLLPPLLLFTLLSTPISPPPGESPRGVLLHEPTFVSKQRRGRVRTRQALQIRKRHAPAGGARRALWCCLHVQVCCAFGCGCSRGGRRRRRTVKQPRKRRRDRDRCTARGSRCGCRNSTWHTCSRRGNSTCICHRRYSSRRRCRNRMCRLRRTDPPREGNHIVLAQRAPKVAQENDERAAALGCAPMALPLHRARRSNSDTIPLS